MPRRTPPGPSQDQKLADLRTIRNASHVIGRPTE
jgi:hypothetical protein